MKYAPKSEPGEQRSCNRCGRLRLVPDEIKPLGRSCFACQQARRTAYWQEYYALNREQQLAYQAAYRAEHHDEMLAKARDYAAEHREERRQYARVWYLKNREIHRSKTKEWREANPELQAEYRRRNYARRLKNRANRERYLEDSRMRARLKAEREGHPMAPLSLEEYRQRYGSGPHKASFQVPVAPLAPHLKLALATRTAFELAQRAGTSDKRVAEIARDGRGSISWLIADALCVELGLPFSWLYQDVA